MPEESAPLAAPADDPRLPRLLAWALPPVTVVAAGVVGVAVSPATSILVLAAGVLLGVIALFWTSVRILSGDVELSPELLALDMGAHGVDALAARKKMLLRALKDLENERAIGKIEDEDFQQIAGTLRAELKTVLQRIDDSLAPHRARADEIAREHLAKVGLGAVDKDEPPTPRVKEKPDPEPSGDAPARVACPSCGESNETDAKFCKACATKLVHQTTANEATDGD